MRKVFAVILVLVLFVLPLAVRRLYFYQGQPESREVPRPDLAAIKAPAPDMVPFEDRYVASTPGAILVDVSHENRFEMSELSVLQARLSARGQWIEPVRQADDLAAQLRYARALVIISPSENLTADEIQLVKAFVDKGGRLLLITDPTNYGLRLDDYGYLIGLSSDVDRVNDLAAQFGLLFQADYLYNTVENEGNFRNIKLTDLAEAPLTQGMDQVVFYATHSIISDEPALVNAGGETLSSSSERAEELAVAVLAADGAVLALGDLTFMAEPHNAVYDNDQFIANIADFLSGAQRQYELSDAPFFFDDEVDLIYAGDPLLDSDLLAGGGDLQAHFENKGKTLTIREAEDPAHDTLFLGLYAYTEEITPYLTTAGVTFVITPTGTAEEPKATPAATETLTVTAPITTSHPLTATPGLTPSIEAITVTQPLTVTPSVTVTAAVTLTPAISPLAQSRVEIASLGDMIVTGTALLSLQPQGERQVLLVLAHTETGLENAVARLTEGNLEDCLLQETESPPATLALCPTGEVEAGEGGGGWQEPEQEAPPPPPTATATPAPTTPITDTVEPEEPVGEPEGSIIVMAFDESEGRYDSMTSIEDYETILERRFDVTVWRKSQDEALEMGDLLDYDLVIWTTGDFEDPISDEDSEMLVGVILGEIPLVISGAYLDEFADQAVQRDIQVADADHPMAQGFEPGGVISFVAAPSGSEYEIDVMDDDMGEEGHTIFNRGPGSEEAGTPSVYVMADEIMGMRIAFIGFPLYLLPQEARSQLVLNTVDWMLESE
ncbi:MAG: hypothetical protein PVF45_00470 [Anaerolineae bacterium]|jgi:hypothetical protein